MLELTIAGLARAGGVRVETVRYYQRRGLLETPERLGCLTRGQPAVLDGEALTAQEVLGLQAIGADMLVHDHAVECGLAGLGCGSHWGSSHFEGWS